jgi:hypothetical protein
MPAKVANMPAQIRAHMMRANQTKQSNQSNQFKKPRQPRQRKLTAFERMLLVDPSVRSRLDAKEMCRRRNLKDMRDMYRRDNLPDKVMARKLAERKYKTSNPPGLAILHFFQMFEEKDKETLREKAKLRREIILAKYPLEEWEVEGGGNGNWENGEFEGESDGESDGEFE